MLHLLAQNNCPKSFCFLYIRYYHLFSLFTSIYLLIKSTLIISEKPILLELTQFLLVSVDLINFHFNSSQYLLFPICTTFANYTGVFYPSSYPLEMHLVSQDICQAIQLNIPVFFSTKIVPSHFLFYSFQIL